MKIPIEKLTELYAAHKSVYIVAEIIGCGHQNVHQRLRKAGTMFSTRYFSDEDKDYLISEYDKYASTATLSKLATKLGRTKQFVCRKAKEFGLTNQRRKKGYEAGKHFKSLPHPKGMLGKKHTQEVKDNMVISSKKIWGALSAKAKSDIAAKSLKSRLENKTVVERKGVSWKGAWRTIGDHKKYYRSAWEANYARYLEFLKLQGSILNWEHEPETFWFDKIKRGVRSYLPDFRVTELDGSIVYHEVKGWMDARSKTKINRMRIYHPKVKLKVIDSAQYKTLSAQLKSLIKDWEHSRI